MQSELKRMCCVLLIAVFAVPAHADRIEGNWFLHTFGEMRAYFGDFLDVCGGAGFSKCRTVQYVFDEDATDGFFGEARLSVVRVEGGDVPNYTIEIFIRELPDQPEGPFIFSIDGEVFDLAANDWQAGSPEGYNVAETVAITSPTLTTTLVEKMKSGNALRVLHSGWKETRFQLRGFTKALDAIETRLSN